MKVPVSWLREFVDVPGSAQDIATTMSVRGFAVEGIEEADGDTVIDFEVTGNRPDCMSIAGMAREIATAFELPMVRGSGPGTGDAGLGTGDWGLGTRGSRLGSPVPEPRLPVPDRRSPIAGPGIDILIDDPDLCRCYVGAVADVTVGPSPAWLQARLKACGIRPISNIVDITNYVLLEMGQPMHAFDRAKLGGAQIRVRRARAGERLATLDGQDRALAPDMLVIADADRPVAVAGVMGGADSEVSDSTRTIVFESAYFDPLSVRRTSRRLGLKTEASMRFERGIDPTMAEAALLRACALLERIGAGAAGPPIVAGTLAAEERRLTLRRARIEGFLGLAVPDADVTRILQSLGFALRPSAPHDGASRATAGGRAASASPDDSTRDDGRGWMVTVPPRRVDIAREVDLIEEVARHYGFDRIPSTFPAVRTAPPPPDPQIARARRVRHVMTGVGFSEAVTFGFTSERAALPFVTGPEALVHIKNPLSEAFAVLRPSLLPGLVESAAINVRRGRPDVRLFEGGARFVRPQGARQALAFVWTGSATDVHWQEKPRAVDFFDAKGVVENLALAHGLGLEFGRADALPAFLTPGKAAALLPRALTLRPNTSGDVPADGPIGVLGELSRDVADAFGLPATVVAYVAELDWDILSQFEPGDLRITPVPRFPSVVRDISILLDDRIEARTIRTSITESAGEILEDVREFDRYQGKGIPDDKVSLSLRLTFRSPQRTLTDADVQRAMDMVVAALRDRHGAVQR
jgi:phenylalanyl-tRNA synthetase beta chain